MPGIGDPSAGSDADRRGGTGQDGGSCCVGKGHHRRGGVAGDGYRFGVGKAI